MRRFLARPVYSLTEKGDIERVADAAAPRRPLLILPRALYRHTQFERPRNVAQSKTDAAALLFAEGNAPYPETDSLVTRAGDNYNVWQWDRGAIETLIGDSFAYRAEDMRPASLFSRTDDGARQIATPSGIEAQIWQGGDLVASAFRRQGFSDRDWQWFLRANHFESADPPAPVAQNLSATDALSIETVEEDREWKIIAAGAAAIAASFLVIAAFQLGRGAFYAASGALEQAAINRLDTAGEGPGSEGATRADVELMRTLHAETNHPNPVALLETAILIADSVGLTLSDWSLDTNRVRFGVNVTEGATISDFAALLEESPHFSSVVPQIEQNSGRTNFRADISGRGAGF